MADGSAIIRKGTLAQGQAIGKPDAADVQCFRHRATTGPRASGFNRWMESVIFPAS